MATKKFRRQNCVHSIKTAFIALTFLHENYLSVFCGLKDAERTKFSNKKKENGKKGNEKNLIEAKSGLVGMKGYLKTYNNM